MIEIIYFGIHQDENCADISFHPECGYYPSILYTRLVNIVSASEVGDWVYDRYEKEFCGFVEARQGWRLQDDPAEKDESISELLLQLG